MALRRFATLCVAITVLASCRGHVTALPHPLVVIGADGLEWRLVSEMIAKGRMPEIARLVKNGSSARLATLAPTLSPAIWTSMATGVVPERHGITGFVQPGMRDTAGQPRLFTNRERRVKALWNIADDADLRSCIVGYWMTFPVEKLHGVMVAQTGTPPGGGPDPARKGTLKAGLAGQVYPPELAPGIFGIAADAQSQLGAREAELYGDSSAWPAAMQRLVEHSRWSLAADAAYERIAVDLVSQTNQCDLVVVYLGLPDVLGHRFWRWTYPGDFTAPPSPQEVARYGDVLRHAYERVDKFVGEVRRAAGPAGTIVVVSDHGMGPFRPAASVDVAKSDGELIRTGGHSAARDALFVAAGPGIARGTSQAERSGSVLDVAPTLLALLGLARGSDMDGHVLSPVLDAGFVRAHPLREVPTLTPEGWQDTRRLAETADEPGPERLEQLRGLGYLE